MRIREHPGKRLGDMHVMERVSADWVKKENPGKKQRKTLSYDRAPSIIQD